MQVLCPHCHNPVEMATLSRAEEIVCSSCGSSFHLEGESTTGWAPANGPRRLGRFEVLQAVGVGAFGTVYKARDPELDRVVAVKVPRAGHLPDGPGLDRFLREARSVARLRHAGIVPVHEVGQHDGVPYLVSEFVHGVTLADHLTARLPSPHEAAALAAAVADALHYAHSQGVVHRDIKPSNIMLEAPGVRGQGAGVGEEKTLSLARSASEGNSSLTPDPCPLTPRLMDFGLAKRDAGETTVTLEGQVLGTPAYMSPEQARGEGHSVDGRSDVYSLGVVLYRMLTGELPFRGNTRMLLHQVLHEEPRLPRSLNDRIPRDLETVCLKAMAKEPGGRYLTAAEMADDLRRFLGGEPIRARPVGAIERTWRWTKRRPAVAGLLAALAVMVVASLAALTGLWWQADARRQEAQHAEMVQKDLATIAAEQMWEAAEATVEAKTQAKNADEAKKLAEKRNEEARRNLYAARSSLIQIGYRDQQVRRVEGLLDLQKPRDGEDDLRGFEWHYYRRLLDAGQLVLAGHQNEVNAVAFSGDGRFLASGSQDHTVKVWELSTGQVLRTLTGHAAGVVCVVISRDGGRVASVDRDGVVKAWQTATGQELWSKPGRVAALCSLAFSPDGERLATAADKSVAIHDAATGREVLTIKGHEKEVAAVAFSRDGKRLASGGLDGEVRRSDAASGKRLDSAIAKDAVSRLKFSSDDKELALTTATGQFWVWASRGLRFAGMESGAGPLLTRSGDGKLVAFLSWPYHTVRVWDPAGRGERFALRGHTAPITDLVFSDDDRQLATASKDGTVRVWTMAAELDFLRLRRHASWVNTVAFRPDGQRLLTGSNDGTVRVWETATGKELLVLHGHRTSFIRGATTPEGKQRVATGVTWLAYSPDGRRLATAGADGIIRTWDADTGKPLKTMTGHAGTVAGVAFSPDGRTLASAGWDKTVRLWDADTGQPLRTLTGHAKEVIGVAFSPDGRQVASGSWDLLAKVWDVESGREVASFKGHTGQVESVAFSPDGRLLAAASNGYDIPGEVKVWELASGKQVRSLRGHLYGIYQVVFSRDGKRLATAACEGACKLWDAATGHELFTFHPNPEHLQAVALSPDGLRLALASRDSTAMLLDATPPTPEARLQREAGRRVDELFDRLVARSAVLQQLRDDPLLSEALRREALAFAEHYYQDARRLNEQGWFVASRRDQKAEAYERALRQAEEACRLAGESGPLLNTLGVAQYRAGRYQDAMVTLTRADKLHTASPGGPQPADLAFLAMARHRLGQKDQAKAAFDRLRQVMQKPAWSGNAEAAAFLREAEALLADKATGP